MEARVRGNGQSRAVRVLVPFTLCVAPKLCRKALGSIRSALTPTIESTATGPRAEWYEGDACLQRFSGSPEEQRVGEVQDVVGASVVRESANVLVGLNVFTIGSE